MYELQSWLGTPCIYVLDCSAAGLIINNFKVIGCVVSTTSVLTVDVNTLEEPVTTPGGGGGAAL
jgi:regulator-associated protein of mTOR